MTYRLYIPGPPATKGSTRSMVHSKTGKVVTLPANERLRCYEAIVRMAAAETIPAPLTGALRVGVSFAFQRPKKHFRARGRELRPDAPCEQACQKNRDLDKLVRAVLDGLTGPAFHDDRQVAQLTACKFWAAMDSTYIEISQVSATETEKRAETPAVARTTSDPSQTASGGAESRHGHSRGLLRNPGGSPDAGNG